MLDYAATNFPICRGHDGIDRSRGVPSGLFEKADYTCEQFTIEMLAGLSAPLWHHEVFISLPIAS
jgi:hypothetical protein